ncbi:hypothetical protein [Allokutzneria oryzae]|uniref:FeoB-associated Cys-rich membrane protein n=1 Tax=Allokutzneria oryzae TaxID=1378989 RepID=A0ABV6A881_9PSEU
MTLDIVLVAIAVAVGIALPNVVITELRSGRCPKDCPCGQETPGSPREDERRSVRPVR